MSYTNGNPDIKKCFNAAKMSELGWYSNRAAEISLAQSEEFDGKIIGVADYAISTAAHTLFLEIKRPNGARSYFLTYNRRKGINSGTMDAFDQIVVVEGAPSEQSWRMAKLSPGENFAFPDFEDGRDLEISLGSAASDGSVDYIPVTVKLQTVGCSSDSDCSTTQPCQSGTCTLGACVFTAQQSCCGNGVCESSDGGCGACSSDCTFPTNCNEIDYKSDSSYGGFYGDNAFGIAFDVSMTTDVNFYELEADVLTASGIYTKVYTKSGSYATDSNLNNWQKVFDGVSSPSGYQTLMKFSSTVFSGAGSTRAFYISFGTGGVFIFGQNFSASNGDGTILPAGTIVRTQESETLPNALFSGSLEGGVKYDYASADTTPAPTPVPTPAPVADFTPAPTPAPKPTAPTTCSDSKNLFTATKPGDRGWVKQKSCDGWVLRKSTAWRCYKVGGVAEACPKTCTNCCEETEGTFQLLFNQKIKDCAWAAINPATRCKKPPTRQLCPNACGLCDDDDDDDDDDAA